MLTNTKNIIFPPDAIVTLEMILKNGLEKKCINHKVEKTTFPTKELSKSAEGAAKNAKHQKMLPNRRKLKLIVTENSDHCP